MFVHHLISRSKQLFILGMLLLTLMTTALSIRHSTHQAQAPQVEPTANEVADGWSDPIGG